MIMINEFWFCGKIDKCKTGGGQVRYKYLEIMGCFGIQNAKKS